jgi:hypothetical protein
MRRLTMTGAVLALALGSALAVPVTAQAATPATSAARPAATPAIPVGGGYKWEFSGATFATYDACYSAGAAEFSADYPEVGSFACYENDPDAGYDLWVYFDPSA